MNTYKKSLRELLLMEYMINIVSRMRNAKKRIQSYVEDTNIGQDNVEYFLDNLHAVSMQTSRHGIPRKSRSEIKLSEIQRYNSLKEKGVVLNYEHLNRKLLKDM